MASITSKIGSFQSLYRHFVVATSKLRPVVLKEFSEEPILPWVDVSTKIYEQSTRASEHINPLFKTFCDDGEAYLQSL